MRPVNHIMMLLHYSYLQLSNGFEIFIMQIPKAYKPPAINPGIPKRDQHVCPFQDSDF